LNPSAIHAELVKRRMAKAYDLLRTNARRAVAVLVEVATDKKASPAVRVQAATEILDRTLGRPTERMELDVDVMKPWQRLIAGAVVTMRDGRLMPIVGTDAQAEAAEREALEGKVLEAEASDEASETGSLTPDDRY
jgi:5-hydroxyisourate hydrolase-like protein (transthyretin family)